MIGIDQDMLFPSRPCALQNPLTSVLPSKLGCWVCGSPSPQSREGSRKRAGSLGWFSSTASGASGEWRAPEASEAPPPVSPTLEEGGDWDPDLGLGGDWPALEQGCNFSEPQELRGGERVVVPALRPVNSMSCYLQTLSPRPALQGPSMPGAAVEMVPVLRHERECGALVGGLGRVDPCCKNA